MFGSPGGLGLAPITLVLFIAFAQASCSVVPLLLSVGEKPERMWAAHYMGQYV